MPPSLTYEQFFKSATGFEPYPYQINFHLRDRNYAIHTLIAPTGLGKTECFTLDWLWGIFQQRANTPSRLVISLPMRTLTHQTFERVSKILNQLQLDADVSCHKLVGGTGELMDRAWCNHIERPSIIIGTQDQILSRQLFKGYATSRWEWSVHAALLNNDVRIVVDETQLQGVGYKTSILLQKFASKSGHFGSESGHFGRRELVLCSATLDATTLKEHKLNYQSICLGEGDRADGSPAAQKINFPKQLHRLTILHENYKFLIAQIVAAEHICDTLSLCIVNRVDDAIGIMDCLANSGIAVKLLHSQFRGYERDLLCADLANFKGVVISTQVIEAGINLDARKLFTMPCPWASFVQRCGRAGRNRTYADCDVYLLDVLGLNFKPYEDSELGDFWRCFYKLSDVNIATLLNINPPKQHIPGTAQMLTIGVLEGLFDSHPKPDSSCDDVNGYIRGELNATVSVMWREFEEKPDPNWGYQHEELCRIPIRKFYKFYSNSVWVWNNSQDLWELKDKPAANQIVLLPRSTGGYSDRLGFTGNTSHLPSMLPIELLQKSNKKSLDRKINPVTLKQHSTDALNELLQIKNHLAHLDLSEFWSLVADCTQWHDLGKAHPQFQDAIYNPTEIGAKASSMRQYQSKGFRHELASAIGALMHGKCFLFAYIVAAHHGKVRVRVDNFHWLKDEKGLRGLRVGDKVCSCSLGNDAAGNEVKIAEFLIDLPNSGEWRQAVEQEIEKLGVFKLSYLETLVRIADRRASALREI